MLLRPNASLRQSHQPLHTAYQSPGLRQLKYSQCLVVTGRDALAIAITSNQLLCTPVLLPHLLSFLPFLHRPFDLLSWHDPQLLLMIQSFQQHHRQRISKSMVRLIRCVLSVLLHQAQGDVMNEDLAGATRGFAGFASLSNHNELVQVEEAVRGEHMLLGCACGAATCEVISGAIGEL